MTLQLYPMQLPNIKNSREIAAGGEGRIIEHPNGKDVIKIYHQPRPLSFEKHLQNLAKLSDAFVKPVDVFTDNKRVLGFSMKYVNLNDYWLFNNIFNKGFCSSNNLDNKFKLAVLTSLRKELEQIHKRQVIVGDLNQFNIFVNAKAEILFVDVDSFKTITQPHSGVLLDDIRDWTTTIIDEKSDSWAYDILTFWAMTHCHPFKWVVPGNKESLEQRVKAKKSILSKIVGVKIPALYQPFTEKRHIEQFEEIFKGRRYMVNLEGASYVQSPIIVTQPTVSMDLTVRELLHDVTEVFTNGMQFTAKNDKWHLFVSDTQKVVRETILSPQIADKEFVFPSQKVGNYAHFDGRRLYAYTAFTPCVVTIKPELHFHEGSLCILDYGKDIQYNCDIDQQLAGNVHTGQTAVFAKSVLFRNAPIQNFGSKKFLNLPNRERYILQEVPNTTKDAFYCRGVFATEMKNKSIEYQLYSPKPIKVLDYLPHFTVMGPYIFLPDDGFIEVIALDGTSVARFDLPICSRTSKLYPTASGILMLENRILYLLNKKS